MYVFLKDSVTKMLYSIITAQRYCVLETVTGMKGQTFSLLKDSKNHKQNVVLVTDFGFYKKNLHNITEC